SGGDGGADNIGVAERQAAGSQGEGERARTGMLLEHDLVRKPVPTFRDHARNGRFSMNVDTMRRIDRWAGVPLCALATLVVRLRDGFRPRTARAVRRVLFVELSGMGTTILAEPAMLKARRELSPETFIRIFALT